MEREGAAKAASSCAVLGAAHGATARLSHRAWAVREGVPIGRSQARGCTACGSGHF